MAPRQARGAPWCSAVGWVKSAVENRRIFRFCVRITDAVESSFIVIVQRYAAGSWGRAGRREPGLGTGRVGRDRERVSFVSSTYRAAAVAGVPRGSPSE